MGQYRIGCSTTSTLSTYVDIVIISFNGKMNTWKAQGKET